jgi:hypothetical protein
MNIANPYKPRTIRFLELYQHDEWALKIYSISYKNERVENDDVLLAKSYLNEWLSKSKAYQLETYNIATLILHESKEGCFAIINWWTDANMLQNFVYLKKAGETHFEIYSDNGMATCVWEMAVWWHERNAWVKHILMRNENPDVEAYLSERLNQEANALLEKLGNEPDLQ